MMDENKYLGDGGEGSRCSSIRAEKVDKGEGGVNTVRAKSLVYWRCCLLECPGHYGLERDR